jgi:hypothetical protein
MDLRRMIYLFALGESAVCLHETQFPLGRDALQCIEHFQFVSGNQVKYNKALKLPMQL